jgi:hypothetical protein
MFPSQVASYNDQGLLGTASTTANENFDALHPLYKQIAALSSLRKQYPALRRGRQVVRAQSREPGLFAASRIGSDGREILLVFNTSLSKLSAQVEIEPSTGSFKSLLGECQAPSAPGSVRVELPPLGYLACVSGDQ